MSELPNNEPTFTERYLRALNIRPAEEIVGTREWQTKILATAQSRHENYIRGQKLARNLALGGLATAGAIFGAHEAFDVIPRVVADTIFACGGSVSLAITIGSEINILRD